jgi:hypothetical protein
MPKTFLWKQACFNFNSTGRNIHFKSMGYAVLEVNLLVGMSLTLEKTAMLIPAITTIQRVHAFTMILFLQNGIQVPGKLASIYHVQLSTTLSKMVIIGSLQKAEKRS